ncbi:MAG: YigZ family protein, partial [Clostridia bacterium]|nr:YigZ family protein [Clostridia bacterium]
DSATEQRFSDDGEPQGTAGLPMLEVLKKRKVHKTLAVVTRYFGGVKLGASGLVGAYSSSVAEALDTSSIVKNVWADIALVTADYGAYKKIEEICKSYDGEVVGVNFDREVELKVALPSQNTKGFFDKIIDFTLGKSKASILESKYYQFKL